MNNISALRAHDDLDTQGYPTLPEGMERDGFIRLFENTAPTLFNLTDAEISTFVRMAEDPRPSDWKKPDREPCCWRRQGEVAARRSKSRYTINRHEKRLVALGLIEKRTMAHGGRSGFAGCGIFFSNAIALVPAMLGHKHQQEALQVERNLLCNTRSIHKGHLKAALNDLADMQITNQKVEDYISEYEDWPDARLLRRMDMDELRQHVLEADNLTRDVLMILQESENMQHQSGTDATPYIQDTTQELNYVCNASVPERSVDKSTHAKDSCSEPTGSKDCKENKNEESAKYRKGEIRLKLSGPILYGLCSPEMKFYIDAHAQGLTPTEHDVSCAAVQMLRELGINQSAWNDACDLMGKDDAILALIITDANRYHPQLPVKCPGGYLRGMNNAARDGTLNIIASLKGLDARLREE